MNEGLKQREVLLPTSKFLSVVYISGERMKLDGQEAVLLMKEYFGLCTISNGKKCTADWSRQNREIDRTHTELHKM